MNIPTLWRTITRNCYQAITKIGKTNYDVSLQTRSMHSVCSNKSFAISPRITNNIAQSSELLRVTTPLITLNCGFKVKGKPKLRCKDCYFVVREERLYVFCKSKPRHKQMSMKAQERKSWMLSHATQGPQRAW